MPPEPEITNPPASVRSEVAKLAKAIDKVVAAKKPGRNLLIGTWNLRSDNDRLAPGGDTADGHDL